MKKFEINIQLFLSYPAHFAASYKLPLFFIFSNERQRLFDLYLRSNAHFILSNPDALNYALINNNETQSFQLPK